MTTLRAKMIREMHLQRLSPRTHQAYIDAVRRLAAYYGRSPELVTLEEVRAFLHHLIAERRLSCSTCNLTAAGITFLYRKVLGRSDFDLKFRFRQSGKLPEVLSRKEVEKVLTSTKNPKHRVMLMTEYAAGLRASELVALKVKDIHSERMLIRVEQGKGAKDRYTLLSPQLLAELRDYWKLYQPKVWLFAGMHGKGHITVHVPQKAYTEARRIAGITRGSGIHTLRHCFASHLLEAGVGVRKIQCLLGHNSMKTTERYLQVTQKHLGTLSGAFDLLRLPRPDDPSTE